MKKLLLFLFLIANTAFGQIYLSPTGVDFDSTVSPTTPRQGKARMYFYHGVPYYVSKNASAVPFVVTKSVPITGQSLKWDGTTWVPSYVPGGNDSILVLKSKSLNDSAKIYFGGAFGDIGFDRAIRIPMLSSSSGLASGDIFRLTGYTNYIIFKTSLGNDVKIDLGTSASVGQAMVWNGSQWGPGTVSGGGGVGDTNSYAGLDNGTRYKFDTLTLPHTYFTATQTGNRVDFGLTTTGLALTGSSNTFSGSLNTFDNTVVFSSPVSFNGISSPFTVAQVGLVANLNSDYLDNQHGSYYTNAGNLTGSLDDARLSSNVPLKNAANTMTAAQTITTSTGSYGLTVTGTNGNGIIGTAQGSGGYGVRGTGPSDGYGGYFTSSAGTALYSNATTGTPLSVQYNGVNRILANSSGVTLGGTLSLSSPLPTSSGGTGTGSFGASGTVAYSNGSSLSFVPSTANRFLMFNGTSAPTAYNLLGATNSWYGSQYYYYDGVNWPKVIFYNTLTADSAKIQMSSSTVPTLNVEPGITFSRSVSSTVDAYTVDRTADTLNFFTSTGRKMKIADPSYSEWVHSYVPSGGDTLKVSVTGMTSNGVVEVSVNGIPDYSIFESCASGYVYIYSSGEESNPVPVTYRYKVQ